MAKINLLTMHYDDNNGAFMQAYSTSKILKQLGHEVTIINLVNKNWYIGRFKQLYTYKLLLRYWKFYLCRHRYYPKMTSRMFQPNLDKIPYCDYTIVGSDQVWNPMITAFSYPSYFLTFLPDDVKRISLSSSFGTKLWSGDEKTTEMAKSALHKFQAISVREKTGVDICKNVFGLKAIHLSDPTLVLDDYSCFERKYCGKPYVGLFTFKRDGYSLDVAKEIAKRFNLPVKWVNSPVPYKNTEYIKGCAAWKQSPVDWFNYIKHSNFFISDSFHGVAFCIILHVPFVALCANERKIGRIESLLDTYGLSDRLIWSVDELIDKIELLMKPIDWVRVDQIRQMERHKYLNYVTENIR